MDPQGEVSLGGVQSVWSHVTEGFRKTNHKTPLTLQFLIFLQESCKLENIIYIYTLQQEQIPNGLEKDLL